MDNNTFEFHLEKALEAMLKSSNIDYKNNPEEAKLHIKNNLYSMVSFYLLKSIDNLLSK
jgi:hypothetical protein